MAKKNKNLQPWLDYFDMLHNYEHLGLLELQVDKHEAYIAQSALHAMTPGDDAAEQLRNGALAETLHRLHAYAAFCAQQGDGYLALPFALHVIRDEPPNEHLYILLLTHRRSWRNLWRTSEYVEVIKV